MPTSKYNQIKQWLKTFFIHKVDQLLVIPTNIEALDQFVADIINHFNLPNTDDTYDNIATMIMHMPPSACRAPMRYFGESVLKSMANKAAYEKLAEFRAKREEQMKFEKERQEKLPVGEMNVVQQVDTSKGIACEQSIQDKAI